MNYSKDNAFNIVHYIVIPKADHFIALQFQIFRSFFIILFLLYMLAAIQLDHKFFAGRAKVGNK